MIDVIYTAKVRRLVGKPRVCRVWGEEKWSAGVEEWVEWGGGEGERRDAVAFLQASVGMLAI